MNATELKSPFYRLGAAAILIAVVVFRRHLSAELMLLAGLGVVRFAPVSPPGGSIEWFILLRENTLVGLWLFDLFDLVNYALVGLFFLGLYGALRRVRHGAVLIAAVVCFLGIAVYFSSNQALAMLSLSNRYAAAATEKSLLAAAGQALLSLHNPGDLNQGTGIYLGLFLVILAGLIVSIAMLRSRVFSNLTAWFGIVANASALIYFPMLVFAPLIAAVPPAASAPFRLVWYVLCSRQLVRLASMGEKNRGMSEDPYRYAARTYDLLVGSLNVSLKRQRLRLAPPVPRMKVLDVGCGTGSDLQLYAEAGCLVYGVDLSPAMLQVARRRLGDRVDLRLCSALQLPFKDDSFDLVMATYTLHEIPNRNRPEVVREMMRVVKPKGRILLTDYQPRCFRFPAGWISAMLIFIFEFLAGGEHFRNGRDFIRRGGVEGLVRRSLLSVERKKVVGGGNVAFFLISARPMESKGE